jgi:hypothetical protein
MSSNSLSTTTSMRSSPPAAASSPAPATPLRGGEAPLASLMKEFGSTTTVPHNDICYLSYYLKCCILGCGFGKAFNAESVRLMMDYNNAHRLPSSHQQAIYHIVMSDFHPQTLMNQVFFIDDSSALLEPGTMNAFFEWSSTISQALRMAEHGSRFLASNSDEQGQREAPNPIVQRKLMVCTSSWLNEYCILPLYRLSTERLAMSALSFTSTAAAVSGTHCRGEGSAAPNARDRSAFLLLSDRQDQNDWVRREHQHSCGFSSSAAVCCSAATCTCRQNHTSAASPVENEQYHAHAVVCGGSDCVAGGDTPIRGPRYRCNVCPNLYLCEICYNDLTGHDQTHAFEMIATSTSRAGTLRPRLLQARVQAVTECCSSTLCNNGIQEDVPVAFAVPILLHQVLEEEKDGADGQAHTKKKHKRRRRS